MRHERLTHRKDQGNKQDELPLPPPSIEPDNASEPEPPRKRVRASFDGGRPVPEIRSMMTPSPAIIDTQYAPATPFNPMTAEQSNNYSLTALSMAAEYQALHGHMREQSVMSTHQNIPPPPVLPPVPAVNMLDNSQAMLNSGSMFHIPNTSLEESLDSLASFLDNEPLNTFHFSSLISAEQPM